MHIMNSPVLIICGTKIYQTQTLHNNINTSLLAYASHYRRWLEKFPLTLEPTANCKKHLDWHATVSNTLITSQKAKTTNSVSI